MTKGIYISTALSVFLAITSVKAQTLSIDSLEANRFVTKTSMYGVGYTNLFDTYLSPQEYTGTEFRYSKESMRMTKIADGNVSMQTFFQTNVGYTKNRADNNNTFSGLVNINYAWHYNFIINEHLKLLAGGALELNGGFIYNFRNSNNPASAKAYINLAPSGMAIWNFRLMNRPMQLRYQANVPIIGAMFSPHYGESYYEIFTLNNKKGTIKATSLNNQPSIRQMLTLDFPVFSSKMRVGYYCDIQQSKINGLKTHTYSHVFMIGFVKELYKIRTKNR